MKAITTPAISKYDEAEFMLLSPHLALALQAFAEGDTTPGVTNFNTVTTDAADAAGTGSDISASMRTYYHRKMMDNNTPNLVHEQFATDYGIPEGSGRTINMRRMEQFPRISTDAPLTEGVAPAGQALRVDQITCEVEQFGAYVAISDMVSMTASDPLLDEAAVGLGFQAADLCDRYVRNKMVLTTNVSFAPKSSGTAVTAKSGLDATCLMTLAAVRAVVTKMKRNKIKPLEGGYYVCIIHPNVVHDLRSSEDFKDWTSYAESGVQRMYHGEVGIIEKVRFVESPNALVERNEADTLAIYHNLFIGRGAYGKTRVGGKGTETIIKSRKEVGGPLEQFMTIGWKTVIGAKVTNDEALCDFMCASSYNDEEAN